MQLTLIAPATDVAFLWWKCTWCTDIPRGFRFSHSKFIKISWAVNSTDWVVYTINIIEVCKRRDTSGVLVRQGIPVFHWKKEIWYLWIRPKKQKLIPGTPSYCKTLSIPGTIHIKVLQRYRVHTASVAVVVDPAPSVRNNFAQKRYSNPHTSNDTGTAN